MPPRGKRATGRYSQKEIALRIERAMGRSVPPVQQKELAELLGVSEGQVTRKFQVNRSQFYVEELGLIADFFDAPTGWPFVDADVKRRK